MRGLDDSTDVLIRVGQSAGEQVKHGWDAFVNFAARDNVLEVALGLMFDVSFWLICDENNRTDPRRHPELPMRSRKSSPRLFLISCCRPSPCCPS